MPPRKNQWSAVFSRFIPVQADFAIKTLVPTAIHYPNCLRLLESATRSRYDSLAMADLKSAKLIYFKGFLFLFAGLVAVALVLAEQPTLKVGLLLVLAIWCFCRFYYFAFYVIEHYVDGNYRFAGLWDFLKYCLRKNERN